MSLSQFLRQVPLFDCLGEAELEALAELTVTRSFDKGQFIIMAEEPGDSLFIIRSGQVKVSLIHEDGKEFILSLLGEGEVFGELSLLDDQPRSANVTAMAPTELVMLQRANFRALMTRIPQIAVSLLEELAQRLRRTDDQVEGLALLDVHHRVAKTILRLAADQGEPTNGGVLITGRPTHQQLANMAGTTRETVTRELKQLEQQGYIVTRGRDIIVVSPEDGGGGE
ncbi:MAG: Crp/Fnr family transcriptional regulator [Gemmatimonadetes bacterium]|jgi:CRP/FNR family transcriptional regulator, cyclic AMP receptor protein|nr:Crp/Fnr family transcriptional regulator [Gemmatimonadota bacterium]MBT6146998.1 Crp/Fnr family transcriptional regulator [Gemmatimonadota bacterium]MBT7862091.1 Crp/Fnr family transcriptional regulator [Gemmatimonadota bacterium]